MLQGVGVGAGGGGGRGGGRFGFIYVRYLFYFHFFHGLVLSCIILGWDFDLWKEGFSDFDGKADERL